MTKYFLLGYDSIYAYQKGGPIALVDSEDNYGLFKYVSHCMTINDLLDAVVGYDAYMEITIEEYVRIKRAKNIMQWHEFISRIDPEDKMPAKEMLEYLSTYYLTPEFIHDERLV